MTVWMPLSRALLVYTIKDILSLVASRFKVAGHHAVPESPHADSHRIAGTVQTASAKYSTNPCRPKGQSRTKGRNK
jgi:hypothetical protein